MIKNKKLLEKFEREFARSERLDLNRKYKILDALYREAVALGKFPPADPMEGIETKIKIARIINSVPKSSKKTPTKLKKKLKIKNEK